MPRPFESLHHAVNGNQSKLAYRPKGHTSRTPNGVNGTQWTNVNFIVEDESQQDALFLHAAGEYYKLTQNHEIPQPKHDAELLVQVVAIGLNPVDWKGADFGFGQPDYPWINGRDFAGVVVHASGKSRRIRQGDVVFGSSTDYRDIRKASFQEYLIASHFNVSRLPEGVGTTVNQVAALGTAFIAAVVGLGVCFGIDFSQLRNDNIPKGPDLLTEARINKNNIPKDTRPEVMSISSDELPRPGEWLCVWGCGPAGQFFCQLAKLAGLKVACVDDLSQVGGTLAELGVDFMIDFKAYEDQPDRLVEILWAVTGGKLRFGVDTVGEKTAKELQKAVQPSASGLKAHIAGLSGLSDDEDERVVQHKALPIKLFHELPEFGEGISTWLEELLITNSIHLPQVETAEGGLSGINDALDRLRRGEIVGKRIVVPIRSR